ncbi:hypothetical protein VB711_04700 [Cronbergia sp. UHCC 0137]|uniref:hypothetical protein n=1 Tax=Cronbergia sp. UHCC 0137 TaxID=3110239 RepID=UPI002B21CBE0|nr:hypothetical protein [Cronbergia sp. UHCC 0137]MEA5617138.1 hypothetical protein [Cronbergia sp. UHCC 0137]
MNQITPKQPARRGRIFPELTLSPEELAKREAEREAFHKRCRAVFERVRPELMKEHYNWYIAVEPDSGDYFVDQNMEIASKQARDKHPHLIHFLFRINETGVTGRI